MGSFIDAFEEKCTIIGIYSVANMKRKLMGFHLTKFCKERNTKEFALTKKSL